MPRMARIVLPQIPHHMVQRGHNRRSLCALVATVGAYLCAAAASALELAEDVLKQVEQWFAATEDPQADTKGTTMS